MVWRWFFLRAESNINLPVRQQQLLPGCHFQGMQTEKQRCRSQASRRLRTKFPGSVNYRRAGCAKFRNRGYTLGDSTCAGGMRHVCHSADALLSPSKAYTESCSVATKTTLCVPPAMEDWIDKEAGHRQHRHIRHGLTEQNSKVGGVYIAGRENRFVLVAARHANCHSSRSCN